jgi:hypothetical protein
VLSDTLRVHIRERVLRAMKHTPPPTALMGRIDAIIPFVGFNQAEIDVVVSEQLDKLKESFAQPAVDEATHRFPDRHVTAIEVGITPGLLEKGRTRYSIEDGMRGITNFSSTVATAIVAARTTGTITDACTVGTTERSLAGGGSASIITVSATA